MEGRTDGNMSFWEHLDVLRKDLVKIAVATLVFAITAFFFKKEIFSVILAPKNGDFVIYRLFDLIDSWLGDVGGTDFSVQLINTGLTEQFLIHVKTSMYVGFLCVLPYALYLLFHFVSPGLYADEKKYSSRMVVSGYFMFMIGVLLSYFLIFPLTFRFLGTYQVSEEVVNMISLQSYMDTLIMMCLLMGIVFELPILCWLLGRLGVLSAPFMRRFRKHAVVAILVVAAIITPTSDAFTMLVVALPIWLLYELSIVVVRRVNPGKSRDTENNLLS